ncbi:MAG TPA: hypothetical protein VFV96_11960 [Verrucomicrobiae bacterium]|nr:hypothetical protein [Verrucomicrobiae bacterium]
MSKSTTTQLVAKRAAITTLVLVALYTALWFALEHYDTDDDDPSILLVIFVGVGACALIAAFICVLAFVVSKLEKPIR